MARGHFVSQVIVVIAVTAPGAADAQRGAIVRPEAAQQAANAAATRGDLVAAAAHWKEVAGLYSKSGRPGAQAHALVRLSEAQQAVGEYRGANATLGEALAIAGRSDDAQLTATVQGALGNLQSTLSGLRSNASERTALVAEARRNLEDGLQAAERGDHFLVAASIAINLGNHLALNGQATAALIAYARAAAVAGQGRSPALAARALANHARVALLAERLDAAERSLQSAQAFANALPPSHDTVFTLTSIAYSYAELSGKREAAAAAAAYAAAEQTYRSAIAIAERLDDVLAQSYARGFLGRLYEQGRRSDEALHETRRAVFAGMLAHDRLGHVGTATDRSTSGMSGAAGDALQRWYYQIARLHQADGRHDEAIASARAAANLLQAIRFEVTTPYGIASATFRETVEPVYHFLVRLLLDRSRSAAGSDDQRLRRALLVEARARLESLKAAELRDYFQDDCVDALLAAEREAGSVDPTAAIIYPIVLEDRTELVVELPGGRLDQFIVPVTRAEISASVGRFRRCIGDVSCAEFFEDGQRLYDWLIRPMAETLAAAGVRTLVFAPDGALRTIPMAALFDGRQYLIEQYAIATIPALSLVDPRPFARGGELRVLRTGLSQPVAGQTALPQVRSELDGIGALYPGGDVLLDTDFTADRMKALLARNRYSVVHVASHGEFRNDASEAYLQTSGGPLLMDELADSISQLRFRGLSTAGGPATTALELFVLSACETAEGDERAALGLAGLAIKSGARSAVGTLWNVNDQAASEVTVEFYRQLKIDPALSKAEALRRAQRKALDGRFEHPQYWAPFLLISNWL